MLVLALALAAALLAGLGWAAARIDWTHKVFSAGFWTETPEGVRNAVLVFGGVVAAAIGLALAAFRTHAANLQAKVAEQGHITDRFTKAIEQLGSDKLEIRLGAIYALERIARDSRRDHGPITETLTAYIRERAPWSPAEQPPSPVSNEDSTAKTVKPATDIQAVLSVIGRRRREYDIKGQELNLRATDLRGANVDGANLARAELANANLARADLWWVNLAQAYLEGANLEGAKLVGANLKDARLSNANLSGAKLWDANLRDVDFIGADLRGADLSGADLREARNLTQRQLDAAYADGKTKLPNGLTIGTEPSSRADPWAHLGKPT